MMAVFTRLQENNVQEIGNRYNLTIEDYEAISAGSANSNYFIRAQEERYILTVLEDKAFKQALELGQLLLLLKKKGFPTTRPIFADNGEIAVLYEGKPIMVKHYVEGKVHRELNNKMLHQVGVAMAKLHQIPVPGFLSSRQPYGVQKFPRIRGQSIDINYEKWITKQLSYFEQQKPEGLPQGMIHGDIFYDNVLFREKRLQAILDFEDATRGEKVFDLGMGIVGMCRAEGKIMLEKAQALVSGYEQVRELGESERASLQMFVEHAAATVSCWRYWKYYIDEPDDGNANKHKRMMQVSKGIQNIPKTKFLEKVFGL